MKKVFIFAIIIITIAACSNGEGRPSKEYGRILVDTIKVKPWK